LARPARNTIGLTKHAGSVQCGLTIVADPPQGAYESDYQIGETCQKDVKIFGGWDCVVDYREQ